MFKTCLNLRKLLETKFSKTVDSQQTAQVMLMTEFRLFVDPNLKTDVKAATILNQKRIGRVIDNLQEVVFIEECPYTSTKSMICMNLCESTEFMFMNCDGQSAFGGTLRKPTKTRNYGGD